MEEPKDENGVTYECGECGKKFASMKELKAHRKKEHKPKKRPPVPEREEDCSHTTVPCFTGLDHANVKNAAAYFQDECALCGKKVGNEYKIEYKKTDTDNESVM